MGGQKNNAKLTEKIICHNSPDIVCITETHLKGLEKIDVSGYSAYCVNRDTTNKRRSGGVCIFD